MDKKEKLLAYINSQNYIPLNAEELAVMLSVPYEDRELLCNILNECENEGSIFVTKKGRYMPCSRSDKRYSGTLRCNGSGKFGFLIREDGDDIYIPVSAMGTALHGDTVLVKQTGSRNGKPEGAIVKVTERAKNPLIGVVYTKRKGVCVVRPDDKRFFRDVFIRPAGFMEGAAVGMRVSVGELNVMPDGKVYGRITAVLGESDDLKGFLEGIIIENKIKTVFDKDTLSEAEKISEEIFISDDRTDLRELVTFTIDGELARDFDDAVSLEMLPDGMYRLGVHIADVSEYVKEGSALDSEAYARGTSVYLPDRVIPMLPEKLSNGVCSLNPGVDRLTLSVFMDIDSKGKVTDNSICKSVIRSKERLTYTDMNRLLDEDDAGLKEKYAHIYETLKGMKDLAAILRKKRFLRGAIDFDFPETEIVTDNNGDPIEVRRAERGVSNRMIEEFMLVANETVAEFAYWAEIPSVYRVHESPSAEKLAAFQMFLKPFGLSLKGKIDEEHPVKPKAFEQILETVKGTAIENVVAGTMLRSLMKAEYKAENEGHFGLAAKFYCHFTSPIRRYPDLVVHRSIKRMLDGAEELKYSDVQKAAKHSSEKEIAAEMCERDADDLMKAAYILGFIGCEAEAVVSGVTSYGMYAELENGIEGMIRLENMTDDYYVYNEAAQKLIGERTGAEYQIGSPVNVMIVRSDLFTRKIDFVLSEHVSRSILSQFFGEDKKKRRKR